MRFVIAIITWVFFSACSHVEPMPPEHVAQIDEALTGRTIHVESKIDLRGYWARTDLGRELARALKLELDTALENAGWIVDSVDPEITIRLSAELEGSTRDIVTVTRADATRGTRALTTVVFSTGPDATDRVDAERFPERAAKRIANLFARKPEIVALALEPRPERRARAPEVDAAGVVVAAFDVFDPADELDTEARDQLSEYIAVRVTQTLRYRTIPRAQVRERLLNEKKSSYSACIDQACQIELGKALAAEKVLAPKLIRMGNACALTASIFDLKTETAELAASIKTRCGKEALLESVDRLIEQLTPRTPG